MLTVAFLVCRLLAQVAPKHMALGGTAVVGYDLVREFLRHHEETNTRPKIIDHLIATSVVGSGAGLYMANTVRGALQGFLFLGLMCGIVSWWALSVSMRPGRPVNNANFYYDKDVTAEERERIEAMDQAETLAWRMCQEPGYGLVQVNQAYQQ